jgi:hypothetical protein
VGDWRRFFTAAIMCNDTACLDLVLDEATKALDRRLDELGKMADAPETRKEGEEILHAAKRLIIIRAEADERESAAEDSQSAGT